MQAVIQLCVRNTQRCNTVRNFPKLSYSKAIVVKQSLRKAGLQKAYASTMLMRTAWTVSHFTILLSLHSFLYMSLNFCSMFSIEKCKTANEFSLYYISCLLFLADRFCSTHGIAKFSHSFFNNMICFVN